MKHGFMLIELIIATLIASMVAGVLLTGLSQSTRVQMAVDNLVDTSTRIGIVSNQLEKDLMGAFIPMQAKEKKESSAKASGDMTKGKEKEEIVAEQKGPEKKEPKLLEKIFYSTNKDGKLDTLTFVTNNPLVVYVGSDVGVVKPKVVRVQYTLRPEADKKNSYALFRQESMELDLEQYKNVRPYEVIGGIKNCTITFTARIEKKDENKQGATDKAQDKQKISYEYKTLNEWVSEQKKEADKEKEEFPRIPYSIEIKISLWDRQDKREKEFTIVCCIPVDFTEPKKEEKKQPEQPKKDEDKSDALADKNRQQPQKVVHNKKSKEQDIITLNGLETVLNALEGLTKVLVQR